MRRRSLDADFFEDEQLHGLGPYAALLLAGLRALADREGRLEDRPSWIKSKVLPYYRRQNVDRLLQALHDARYLQRYGLHGQCFIQLLPVSWRQVPHPREAQSLIPPPPENPSEIREVGTERVNPGMSLDRPRHVPGTDLGMSKNALDSDSYLESHSASVNSATTPRAHARDGWGWDGEDEGSVPAASEPARSMPGYAVAARTERPNTQRRAPRLAGEDDGIDFGATAPLTAVEQAYLDAGRSARLSEGVLHRAIGLLGAAVREYGEGVAEEVLVEAARRNAVRPNASPQRLDFEIREVQLERSGAAQGRPSGYVAPVTAALQAIANDRARRQAPGGASA